MVGVVVFDSDRLEPADGDHHHVVDFYDDHDGANIFSSPDRVGKPLGVVPHAAWDSAERKRCVVDGESEGLAGAPSNFCGRPIMSSRL